MNLFAWAEAFGHYEVHLRCHKQGGCCCLDHDLPSPCCPQHKDRDHAYLGYLTAIGKVSSPPPQQETQG